MSNAITLRMRVHGWLNAWNYFYKQQATAWLRAWPSTTANLLRDISFQIRLAILLGLLSIITKQLGQLTNGKA